MRNHRPQLAIAPKQMGGNRPLEGHLFGEYYNAIAVMQFGERMDQDSKPPSRPFLLMEGGPLYHLQQRAGPGGEKAKTTIRVALMLPFITWLPLLILTMVKGTAFGNTVELPFLSDFGAYTRLLLAIPLFLVAENFIGPLIAETAEHFITSGVIGEDEYPAFDRAIEDGLRLRDSVLAEILIVLLAYAFALVVFFTRAAHVSTWYATRTDTGVTPTLAGWWLVLFCTPLLQFLLLRWIWRIFLWFRFLHRISKLQLNLYPTHPDQAGGLGFVGEAQRFFSILLFSYSVGVAGVMANEILYDHIPLKHYGPIVGAYVLLALIIILGPLAVFSGKLLKTKRHGLHDYGTLATSYTGSFQKKWIDGVPPAGEPLLGTGDIQSLADLGNSYSFVERMSALPVNPRTPLLLAVAALLPMLPLLLTVMPAKEVAKLLFKMIM
jgi:hypothetical protein